MTVAPRVGAWIETLPLMRPGYACSVAPRVGVYLYRGSTQIQKIMNIITLASLNLKDTPGVGTFTYYVKVKLINYYTDSGVGSSRNNSLTLIEVKK